MRLEQFKYLLEIGRTGSMNRTGENLHVSQQAISTAIRLLESELQTEILLRTSKGVQLTAAGERVLAAAEDIFDRIGALQEELQSMNQREAQKDLVIMLHGGMLRGEMAQMIPKLYEAFRDYRLKVLSCQNHEMAEAVAAREAYLGLTYVLEEELAEIRQRGLSFQRLSTYHFGVFASRQSVFAQYAKVSLAEIVQVYPIMVFEEMNSESNMVQQVMHLKGMQKQARYLAVSDDIFDRMIDADKAVGVVFQSKRDKMVEQSKRNGVFIPLTDHIPVYSGYIIAKENQDAVLTKRFRELLSLK